MPEEKEITVQSLFDGLEKWGGSLLTMVPRDEDDVALKAVIVVEGVPETQEILDAIEKVQEMWWEEDDRERALQEENREND